MRTLVKRMLPPVAIDVLRVLKDKTACRKYARYSDRELIAALGAWFAEQTGETLDLEHPITFNQKTQWLKVYDSTKEKGRLADKYLVRQHVADRIGSGYLVPLIGVYDSVGEIDFESLPDRFVLKATHGSGWNIVVQDKRSVDERHVRRMLRAWLKLDFAFLHGFEMHYQFCEPRIVAEEYLDDVGSETVDDYKVYCFNGGEPVVCVCRDRFSGHALGTAYYDKDWNALPFCDIGHDPITCARPPHLHEMIELSRRLADGFAFVRVDWYESSKGLLFGEMTFTSASGTESFSPVEWNVALGDRIDLTGIKAIDGRFSCERER